MLGKQLGVELLIDLLEEQVIKFKQLKQQEVIYKELDYELKLLKM